MSELLALELCGRVSTLVVRVTLAGPDDPGCGMHEERHPKVISDEVAGEADVLQHQPDLVWPPLVIIVITIMLIINLLCNDLIVSIRINK